MMQSKNDVCRGVYVEAITAKIMAGISGIVASNVSDIEYLAAQAAVRKIINQEYVEYEKQKESQNEPKAGKSRKKRRGQAQRPDNKGIPD